MRWRDWTYELLGQEPALAVTPLIAQKCSVDPGDCRLLRKMLALA